MPSIGLPARFSLQDQALFAKRLAMLTRAGVPILESLNIIKEQMRSRANARLVEHISRDVASGQYLSRSIGKFRRTFGEFAINIIRVGETTGTLSDNLAYLAQELEKERELRRKVVSAMIYPVVIMVVAVAVSALLTVFLFPKLLPVFQSLKVDLPPTTRALLWISNYLIHYGLWTLAGVIIAIIATVILTRFKPIRFAFHRAILVVPVIGSLVQNYHLTNMCRTFGLLLRGSLSAPEATRVTAETVTNLVYRKELNGLTRAVTHGTSIATHLAKRRRLFPHMLTQMVAVAEKTGNLPETFTHLAEIYEGDLDEKIKRLSTIIEPVLMISMGLIVGVIAVSIITPIYEVTQNLSPTR